MALLHGSAWDSLIESNVVASVDEQTDPTALQDDELD